MNRGAVIAFAVGPVGAAGLSFVALGLSTWHFAPEDLGRHGVFQIFISCMLLVTLLGLDQAYVREYHESRSSAALLRACVFPGFLLSVILVGASIPLAGTFSRMLYGIEDRSLFFATSAAVVLSFISRYLALVLRMQERGLTYSATQILPKLVLIGVLLTLINSGTHHAYRSLLLATVTSIFAGTGLLLFTTMKDVRAAFASPLTSDMRPLLRFGLPLTGAALAYWFLGGMGTVFLRSFGDYHELGIYVTAASFGAAAAILQNVFSSVWMPTVYKWAQSSDAEQKVRSVTAQVTAAVSLALAAVGASSWFLSILLPDRYRGVESLLTTCAAPALLYTLSECTVVGLNIHRKGWLAFVATLGSVLCGTAACAALIPRFGAAGAASAIAGSYFVFFVLRTELSAKLGYKQNRIRLYTPIGSVTAAAIAVCLTRPSAPGIISLLWLLALIGLAYLYRSELRAVRSFFVGSVKQNDPEVSE